VAAWWNSANVGDPAPAPPAPPDVHDGDLFVQGSNAAPSGTPVGAAPPSSQALAGLAFDLQPTDLVSALKLTVDGSPPPQVTVDACKATGGFASEQNGPWNDVPAYDANACAPGALKGNDVVFGDVSKLVTNSRLAVVLVPGPVDRVVFKKPSAGTLAVTHAGSVGSSAPAFGTGTGTDAGAPATVAGGSGAAFAQPPPSGGAAGLPGAPSTGAPAGQAPVVAGNSPGSGAVPTAARTAASSSSGLTPAQRRGIGLAVIALEVLGFALLRRMPDGTAAAVGPGIATVGGRLRAPDRIRSDAGPAGVLGGVGRFRRERRGAVPHV